MGAQHPLILRHLLLVRATGKGGTLIATTLRPFGGLGCQPTSVTRNPVGFKLLLDLAEASVEN